MLDSVYANRGCQNCMKDNVEDDKNWCEKMIKSDKCELICNQKVYKV